MSDLVQYFSDPLDPARSLHLNNRYWKNETFTHLDLLREADDDINQSRIVSLRKSLKHVKSLLPPRFHKIFVARLVYSMLFSTSFDPIRFKIKLSREFVRANSYEGPDNMASKSARQTEELKYIVDLAHSIYRGQFGSDVLTSEFGVRYVNSTHPDVASRMTKYGEFSDYHLDEGKDFTCIIYLCDVEKDNGCFSYIDGTSSLRKSYLLRTLHQVVGNYMGLALPEQTSELPLELRGSLGIGNFLDDEKRDVLRDSRVDVLGSVGDGIIFSGFDTLHRGGKPLRGERTALFVSTNGILSSRAKKYASQMLAYLWL